MTDTTGGFKSASVLSRLIPVVFLVTLSACVTTTARQTGEAQGAKTTTGALAQSADTKKDSATAATPDSASQGGSSPAVQQANAATPGDKADDKPSASLRIVESCQNEPFVQYERQSQESINKGLAATKAGKFGVGFRNSDQYNKWQGIHRDLFIAVNQSCEALKQCASDHPKDKAEKCTGEAFVFNEWQNIAQSFTSKARVAEVSEPDPVCSFKPNLDDLPNCFHGLGDNIDKVCTTPDCKEASDCWRGIGFLDQAIKQAAQACGFVHTELSTCRGYMEATKRREDKFKRCQGMQELLSIPLFPAI